MKKELLKIIEYYGTKEKAAKILGITIRHLDNCLNGVHMGTSLQKLTTVIYNQINSLGD